MKKLVMLICLCGPAAATTATEPAGLRDAIAKHDEIQAEKSRRLYHANIPPSDPSSFKFATTLVDLNDDGIPDAIVLFSNKEDCGSGGCILEVYRGTANGFDFVSGSTVSREPIRLLPERKFGWHSFTVFDAGGGGRTCAGAIMRFNGRKYPLNPSRQPCATPAQLDAAIKLPMTE